MKLFEKHINNKIYWVNNSHFKIISPIALANKRDGTNNTSAIIKILSFCFVISLQEYEPSWIPFFFFLFFLLKSFYIINFHYYYYQILNANLMGMRTLQLNQFYILFTDNFCFVSLHFLRNKCYFLNDYWRINYIGITSKVSKPRMGLRKVCSFPDVVYTSVNVQKIMFIPDIYII